MITLSDVVLSILYILALFYTIFWLLVLLDQKEHRKSRPTKLPLVDVIIPAYNEEKAIANSMNSVLKSDYPKDKLHLIVVNDGSKDNTLRVAKRIKAMHPECNITIISQRNQGKYVALNRGLSHCRGEFFACLDADSEVSPNALRRMLPYFTDPKVAVVLPLMKVKNPRTLLQKVQWYEYLVNIFYKRIMSNLNCIHVAPGPFSLYRRDVVKALGGFVKAHHTEDLEIAIRIQRHQHRIVQTLDAEVYTSAPAGIRGLYRQRKRWNMGSVLNAWDNRDMLFNRAYGDFGMLQMPVVLFWGFLSLILVGFILYYSLLKPAFENTFRYSLIHFDLFTMLRNIVISWNVLDINFYQLVVMGIMLTFSLMVFVAAHRHTKERVTKHGIIPLFLFIFIYYIMLGIIWGSISLSLLFRRGTSW